MSKVRVVCHVAVSRSPLGGGDGWERAPFFLEEVVMVLGGDEKTASSYGWKIGQGIGLIRPST